MPDSNDLKELIKALRQRLPFLAERYGVRSLEVFGSYARHEQRSDSDLDVLVTYEEPPSLLGFIEIENCLADLLGVKVDLVMKDSLRPRIGERVLGEAVSV
jgi:predicted nucleotidyltransferase